MNFENEWVRLKKKGTHGLFTFKGKSSDWRSTVSLHFKSKNYNRPCYGVYVVRQKSTRQVIYIGKAGTMCQNGIFKEEDLEKRLVNREKDQTRQIIFGNRVLKHGELLIEYIIEISNNLIPGYLEAQLLQAYFDDHGVLPVDNATL